ncbi:PAS domain-containing protein [Tenacibaculum aestuariivivum]|uniref:PAS domain-containing protein n=1 Tax=Tenacibaculum aestuariivivum TaxID=2006131 RepID=UPI003AB59E41
MKKEQESRKPKLPSPTPVNREVKLHEDTILISITDKRGVIEYCNEDFVDTSGYEEYELVGSGHNIIRHPDMPRVIFKMMWERIEEGKNMIAVVKNMTKTGRYYWVVTDFTVKKDQNDKIIGYKGVRRLAPKKSIEQLIPLYKKLKDIEDVKGIEASRKFLNGFLDTKEVNYDNYIESLVSSSIDLSKEITKSGKPLEKKVGSFFNWFFFAEKRPF